MAASRWGEWITATRGSLSRRNGKTVKHPGEARLSRALPNRFGRSGDDPCRLLLIEQEPAHAP